jgi:hypothetical protein
MGMGTSLLLNAYSVFQQSNPFLGGAMGTTGHNWCEGEVIAIHNWNTIKIGTRTVGTRGLVNIKDIRVGDTVTAYFSDKNSFDATRIVLRGIKERGETVKEKEKEPEVEKVTDFIKIISEMEPQIPQEVIDKLSEEDKGYLVDLVKSTMDTSVRIYDITATYAETKKDMDEISKSVLETALSMAIVIDTNTYQILKKSLPEEKK